MPRPEEFWDQCLAVFDPGEVLVGQRSTALYCERADSPLEDIFVDFRPTGQPTRPPIGFFTGHRGSGKSSLPFRLLKRFTQDFFVVYLDIEHNLDSRIATQIDLLYLLGATIFQVAQNEGIKPDIDNLQELARSVYTVSQEIKETDKEALNVAELTQRLICFGASMLGAQLGEKLAEAALKPFTLTSGVSEDVARKLTTEPRVQTIITNVNLIISDVQTKARKDVLVVVDGLDKLQRFEQAKLVFLDSQP